MFCDMQKPEVSQARTIATEGNKLAESVSRLSKMNVTLCMAMLLTLPAGLSDAVKRMIGTTSSGDADAFPLYMRVAVVSAVLILSIFRVHIRNIKYGYIPYILWCSASLWWSVVYAKSMQELFVLYLTAAVSIILGAAYSKVELVKALRDALFIIVTASAAAITMGFNWAFLDLNVGLNVFGGQLGVGLFGFKIVAGTMSSMLIIMILQLNYRMRILNVLSLVASVFIILSSNSASAIVLLVVGIPFSFAIIREKRSIKAVYISAYFVIAMLIMYLLSGDLVWILNRGENFSGRSSIWDYAIQLWQLRPLSGWGYKAVLGAGGALENGLVDIGFFWDPNHFHNDSIQTLVDVGVIGLLLFVLGIVSTLREIVQTSAWKNVEIRVIYCILCMLLLGSMFNSVLGAQGIGWVLFLVFSARAREISDLCTFNAERSKNTGGNLCL